MISMKLDSTFATLVGGTMTMTVFAGSAADQIYQSGPESLAVKSWLIVTGRVTHYSKLATSASAGAEPIPLTWVVSGQIEQPVAIKGVAPTSPIPFSTEGRSPIAPANPAIPTWQADYGELMPGETAVLFFQGSSEKPTVTALPAGKDSTALVALLEDIVRIQQSAAAEQTAAWLDYLRSTSSDEARKAALRELVRLKTPWSSLAPVLEPQIKDPAASPDFRSFLFGIVTFAVTHEVFAAPRTDAVQFLCREFVATQNPRLLLHYILNLKLLLSYTSQSEGRQGRLPLEKQIVEALNERASIAPLPPELAEQYRQIHATHPAVR